MKLLTIILLTLVSLRAEQDGGFLTDDDFDNLSRSDQLTLLPQAPFAALVRGEFMRGEFLGLTGKGVHWKHAGIIESFHLKTGNIRFLELNPTLQLPPANFEVRLLSGERLKGSLISLDDSTIQLENPFCGRVSIKLAHLDQIISHAATGPALIGSIGTKEDWTYLKPPAKPEDGILQRLIDQNLARWVVHEGELRCDGLNGVAVAREVPHNPSSIEIQLTITSPDDPPELSIHLFADQLEDWRSGNNLSLLFKKGTVAPKVQQKEIRGRMGRPVPIKIAANGRYQIVIRADRTESTIKFELNGETFAEWKSGVPLKGKGQGIILVSRDKKEVRISDFKVFKANARLTDQYSENEARPMEGATITLINGDHVSGKLLGFRDGHFHCQTDFAEIPLKPALVSKILFPKKNKPDKLTAKNQVSLLFQNRDLLTATFIDLSASGIKIEHPLFGPKELPVKSIRVIDFHKRRDGTTSHPSLRPAKKGGKDKKRGKPNLGAVVPMPLPLIEP